MSAVVSLHHMASAVVVRTLTDHNDRHSLECKNKARDLIAKLGTNLYTAVSKDLLELFVESYPKQLPAFMLPVLAPPHLRVMNLKRCCLLVEDSQMDFKNLKETMICCSKLQSLVLDGCNLVLPSLLCDVIIQNAPQLVSVSVEECIGVSDEFVQKLVRGLPNLSHLNISVCPAVTDAVFALTETQGLLEEGAVSQNKDSWGCNLSSVDLSGNQQLTSTCVRHLTELCGPKLRHINVAATRMDCTILWYLSGYSLFTVVQLALEANKQLVNKGSLEGSLEGERLCQLISEIRLLQERLKSLQKKECQRVKEMKESEGLVMEEGGGKVEGDAPVEWKGGAQEREDGKQERENRNLEREGGAQEREDGKQEKEDRKQEREGGKQEREGGAQGREGGAQGREGGAQGSVGGAQGREGGAQEMEGGAQEREGGKQEREGGKQEREDGKQEKEDRKQEREGGKQEMEGWAQGREGGKQEREGGKQEREGGKQEREGGAQGREGGAQEREGGKQEREGGKQEREGGAQEREGGAQEREGGAQEREGGKQEREGEKQEREGEKQEGEEGKLEREEGKLEREEGKLEREDGKLEREDEKREREEGKLEREDGKLEREDEKREREWIGVGGSVLRNVTGDVDSHVGLYVNELIEYSRLKLQSERDYTPSSESCQALSREDNVTSSLKGKAGKQCPRCKKLQGTTYERTGRYVSELTDGADKLGIEHSMDKNATFTSGSEGTRERCLCTGGVLPSLPESSVPRRTISGGPNQDAESSCERTCSEMLEGGLCNSVLNQPTTSSCGLTRVDSANESECKISNSEASANQTTDQSASVEYSHSSDSLPSADPQTRVCKVSSAYESESKKSEHTPTTNEFSDAKTAPACPYRRLYTPCITSLDISFIDFHATLVATCLKEFFAANTQLRKLTVCWKELSDSMLEIIAGGGTELRSLCLFDCSGLTSFGVAHLLSKCRNLQLLDLHGVCYITDTALMPAVMQDNCNIQNLKLSETNISDSTLTCIAKYLGEKIKTLEISWCEEISDTGLAEIATYCTFLEKLTLRLCHMSADTLMSLAWNCNRLVSLNMSGVENLTDGVAQAMAPSLRHLKKLDVSWNPELTDAGILTVMSCCPLMVELYLMGLKRITEKPFMPIISEFARWQRCKKLIKLKMKERMLLQRLGEEHLSSDEEYEDLFSPVRSTSYAPCLRTLELQYCDRVNDDFLAELVAICVGTLSVIDYYGMHIEAKLLRDVHVSPDA